MSLRTPRRGAALAIAPTSEPAAPEPIGTALELPDGARAELREGALELRDRAGRLLVRYAAGCAEISVPEGDLTLAAPGGRVVLRSGLDVCIEAERDVTHSAGRRLELRAAGELRVRGDELDVAARTSRLVSANATVLARAIATTAEHMVLGVGRYELVAERIVERARNTVRDVAELAQSRVGRLRTIVRDVYSLRSRKAELVSEEETSIDGRRVLLG